MAAAAILCVWAFYNGYPLVYPDTGTYISAAYNHYLPVDRSAVYSAFLRIVSWDSSLWLTVATQAVIVAWAVRLLLLRLQGDSFREWIFIPVTAVLAFTTGIAVNADQLIADLFTPITVCGFVLLLLSKDATPWQRFVYFGFVAVAGPMHFSHFPLLGILLGLAFLAWFFFLRRKPDPVFGKKQLAISAMAIGGAVLFTLVVNLWVGRQLAFRPQGSHVFMMQRLIHCNILTDYLDKKCPEAPAELCAARSYLRKIDFLWDSQNSPVYAGGTKWMDRKQEYDKIISEIFHEPRYIRRFAWCSLRDSWKQLYRFNTGTVPPMGVGSAPHGEINWRYKKEVDSYLEARQQKGTLHFDLLNKVQAIAVPASAILLLLLLILPFFRRCMNPWQALAVVFIFAAYAANAFTCVTFAVLDDRFSSRLAWLFPLALLGLLADRRFREKITGVFSRRKAERETNA